MECIIGSYFQHVGLCWYWLKYAPEGDYLWPFQLLLT
jgi:hypothetical protein